MIVCTLCNCVLSSIEEAREHLENTHPEVWKIAIEEAQNVQEEKITVPEAADRLNAKAGRGFGIS